MCPSQWQCPWHRAILPVPSLAPRTPCTIQGALQRAMELPPHRQAVEKKSTSNKHRRTSLPKISQAVISRNLGKAVSRQAAALGGCWIEWHFPPHLSRGSLQMIKSPFIPLGLLFCPRATLVPDQAFPRLVPSQSPGNLPLLIPSILLLSRG